MPIRSIHWDIKDLLQATDRMTSHDTGKPFLRKQVDFSAEHGIL